MKPKFELGQKVRLKNRKQGVVVDIINLDDPKDIRIQGYRYYVQCRNLWSVTENEIVVIRPS